MRQRLSGHLGLKRGGRDLSSSSESKSGGHVNDGSLESDENSLHGGGTHAFPTLSNSHESGCPSEPTGAPTRSGGVIVKVFRCSELIKSIFGSFYNLVHIIRLPRRPIGPVASCEAGRVLYFGDICGDGE